MRPLRDAAYAAVLASLAACGGGGAFRVGASVDGNGQVGVRLAVEEIGARGGIDGRPLEVVFAGIGNATSARPAIAAADSLSSDPTILAVVGHSNSATSLAASRIYNARGVPQVAPTTSSPLYSRAGPYSYRLVPSDAVQAKRLAALVGDAGARPRVALAYVNDDYGRGLRETLQRELRAVGAVVVYETPFLERENPGHLADAARAAARAAPDILVWLGRPPQLAAFLPTLQREAPGVPVLGSDGLDQPLNDSLRVALAGVRFLRFIDGESSDPGFQRFRDRFREATGRDVTSEAVLSYDAVILLAEALHTGARTREEVRAYLASLGRERPPFHGIAGPVGFDVHGDAVRPQYLSEITPRGVVTVGRE